jgi:hypothetical protein
VITALLHPASQPETEVPDRSIAVLYFENMSADPESEYYCAGITEDILTDLSKLEGLSVVSRTDVLPFRGKQVNIRQVEGSGSTTCGGSVRRPGQIRITAQRSMPEWLPSGPTGSTDWWTTSSTFAGVASQIPKMLKVSLTQADGASLARRPTDDVARTTYMRGRGEPARLRTPRPRSGSSSALEIDGGFSRPTPRWARPAPTCTSGMTATPAGSASHRDGQRRSTGIPAR